MAGRPGRSGGHNRLSLEAHVLRGTFNPTRHAPVTPPARPAWQPTPADLAPLGPTGRAFVRRQRARYALAPLEGAVVLECAIAADRLAEIRAERVGASATERDALDKRELAWQRAYTTGLCWLRARLTPARRAPVVPKKWAGLV